MESPELKVSLRTDHPDPVEEDVHPGILCRQIFGAAVDGIRAETECWLGLQLRPFSLSHGPEPSGELQQLHPILSDHHGLLVRVRETLWDGTPG